MQTDVTPILWFLVVLLMWLFKILGTVPFEKLIATLAIRRGTENTVSLVKMVVLPIYAAKLKWFPALVITEMIPLFTTATLSVIKRRNYF